MYNILEVIHLDWEALKYNVPGKSTVIDCFIDQVVNVSNTNHEVGGLIPGPSTILNVH